MGPYHLQWITNETDDDQFNQTIENVTGEEVSVFADGDRYLNFNRDGGELIIHTDGSATWDHYQYDAPSVVSDTTVSVDPGEKKTVQVVVENPNDFTLHNVQLHLEHGWIELVEPRSTDIPGQETATFNVKLSVPSGTQSTTYKNPMNVSSVETGEMDTKDLEVSVGGVVASRGGLPVSRFGILAGGFLFLMALGLFQMARSGQFENLKEEFEKV